MGEEHIPFIFVNVSTYDVIGYKQNGRNCRFLNCVVKIADVCLARLLWNQVRRSISLLLMFFAPQMFETPVLITMTKRTDAPPPTALD
jgi:hypothetical protein